MLDYHQPHRRSSVTPSPVYLYVPAVTNSEDAGIPHTGRPSRIKARNLMFGDQFMLKSPAGSNEIRVGLVTNIVKTPGNGFSSDGEVSFTVVLPNAKSFDKTLAADALVLINETPDHRFNRRTMSRNRSRTSSSLSQSSVESSL